VLAKLTYWLPHPLACGQPGWSASGIAVNESPTGSSGIPSSGHCPPFVIRPIAPSRKIRLVVACIALTGGCFGALNASRGLQVAPGNTDMAMGGISMAFNVGTAIGAFSGGRVIAVWSAQGVPLLGAAFTAAALRWPSSVGSPP
jgi:predicted MFS family arabinose efflux permease